jgi:hypothetical protein
MLSEGIKPHIGSGKARYKSIDLVHDAGLAVTVGVNLCKDVSVM